MSEDNRPKRTGDPLRRVAIAACAIVAIATFLPWAHITITLFGATSPPLTAKGSDIESPISGLSYGTLMLILAAIGAIAIRRDGAGLLIAVVTAFAGGYAMVDAVHHVTAAVGANGQDITSTVNPHVSAAFGVYIEGLASFAVLGAALLLRRDNTHET